MYTSLRRLTDTMCADDDLDDEDKAQMLRGWIDTLNRYVETTICSSNELRGIQNCISYMRSKQRKTNGDKQ